MPVTSIADIINPEVLADQIAAKFPTNLVIAGQSGLVQVNTTFPLGTDGTIFTIPAWMRAPGFSAMSEGTPATLNKIQAFKERCVVERAIGAWSTYDVADLVNPGDGNIIDALSSNLARRAAEWVDDRLILKLDLTPNSVDISGTGAGTVTLESITDAMMKLGDQHQRVLAGGRIIMHSKVYGDLLKLGAVQSNYTSNLDLIKSGVVQTIMGLPVELSDRVTSTTVSGVTKYNTYIVGPGSLGLFYQRDLFVEMDRDILTKQTIISADMHFAPHLFGVDDVSSTLVAEDAKSVGVVKLVTK